MLSIAFGLVFAAAGIWMIVKWPSDFMTMIRGLLPLCMIGGGMLGILAGVTSIMDAMKQKKDAGVEGKTDEK